MQQVLSKGMNPSGYLIGQVFRRSSGLKYVKNQVNINIRNDSFNFHQTYHAHSTSTPIQTSLCSGALLQSVALTAHVMKDKFHGDNITIIRGDICACVLGDTEYMSRAHFEILPLSSH